MAVTQRLDLRQSQSLVMTPQLQQAIKLLQYSSLELAAFVEGELVQNPLLEHDERGAQEAESQAAGETSDGPGPNAEDDPPPDDQPLPDMVWDWSGGGGAMDGEGESIEQRLPETPSLRNRLLEQLHMDLHDPTDRIIGIHLIDSLDEAGYLTADLPALAEMLGCALGRVETTLTHMQRFEPSGIFARDLRECLRLQLADRNRLDPAMAALTDNLDLLARRDKARLKRRCGVDDEDLADMVAEIRALDPKPALAFDPQMAAPVIPDVLVRRRPGGAWFVELNNDTLPRVLVNRHYYTRVSAGVRDKRERQYLSERYHSANWLVKALHQRATTILKVAEEIVRQQEDFLNRGLQHLRPLTLRQIADVIEMHESTVSRVTNNKYISTPRGIYELKYFFNASISGTSDGVTHAAEAVRQRVKELIDAEPPDRVLSDDGIVERLRDEGIDIARRTVAKYRDAMHIPSSVQRRRDKALSF